jgi:hypothetical protein
MRTKGFVQRYPTDNGRDQPMRIRLVTAAFAAVFSFAASSGFAQTQAPPTNQPGLADERAKPQQNSADESAPRGKLEAAKEPTGHNDPKEPTGHNDPKVIESNKKLEEAAEKAKK